MDTLVQKPQNDQRMNRTIRVERDTMGTIETTYDLTRDLTIAKAVGKMRAEDHRRWIKSYYAGNNVTQLILWDVTEADYSEITNQEIQNHVAFTKQLATDARKGGKTAVVIDRDRSILGLSRMREIYFKMEGVPIDMRTFYDMDDALQWLGVKDTRKWISKPAKTTRSSREP